MSSFDIILDADAIQAPLTGIGRYAYELAKGLRKHPAVGHLRLLRRYRWIAHETTLVETVPLAAQQRTADAETGWTSVLRATRRTVGRTLSPGIKYLKARRYRNYIYHSPNYALPPFPGLRVSTIHDLSVIRFPEFHPRERVNHLLRLFPKILRRCDLVLTDSEFSRQEILEAFRLPEDRVKTVYLGVDPAYYPRLHEPLAARLGVYGLQPGRYLLSVGTIEPRKNLLGLIQAYEALPDAIKREYPLVLVGNPGWHSQEIHARMRAGQSAGWLIYLNYVREADLPVIYAGARLFVCVSLYEGFGLPVLEAMATGIPVICSNLASLPEVGGQAAWLVDPLCQEEITAAMSLLLSDTRRHAALAARGPIQASRFGWDKTVANTLDAYRCLY